MRECEDCGAQCTNSSRRCRKCYAKVRAERAREKAVKCLECDGPIDPKTKGGRCWSCATKTPVIEKVSRVLREEAGIAPAASPHATYEGEAIVISDVHVPWHHAPTIQKVCEASMILGVKTLIIAGDYFHADTISKYIGTAKTVPIAEELASAGRVLAALEMVFDQIIIIPGNHDLRFNKMVAQASHTREGRLAMEMVAKVLGADPGDPEEIVTMYLEKFYGSPKVTLHPLPEITVNGRWLIQHPASARRVSPQLERSMAHRHRKSVIQGHNHLFGIGFDSSGTDIAANIGHCSNKESQHYLRERPSDFPSWVLGFVAILQTPENQEGYLLPLAVHDRWFDLETLAERLKAQT